MAKRSNFERVERDFYPTPQKAIESLLPFLKKETKFTEPCVGEGHLKRLLENEGHICVEEYDYEEDATKSKKFKGDLFITNPPWNRKILHPIIDNLCTIAPCWLLFDSDWMHTKQSKPFLQNLQKIVSIGRVKWFPNSNSVGKDNCCWYYFAPQKTKEADVKFIGRL